MNACPTYRSALWILATLILSGCASEPKPSPPDTASAPLFSEFARLTYATAWATEKRPGFVKFKNWTQRYAQADKKSQLALVPEGVALAQSRRELLAQLIKSAPRNAIDSAVPAAVRAQLPPEVQALLETRVSGRGDFLALIAEPLPGQPREPVEQHLVSLAGRQYTAAIYGRRLGQQTKRAVPLHGIVLGNCLALHDSPLRIVEPDELPPQVKLAGQDKAVRIKAAGIDGASETDDGSKVVLADYAGEILAFATATAIGELERALIRAEQRPGPFTPRVHLPAGGNGGTSSLWGDPGWTTGPKRVLVIRVDFSDRPGVPVNFTDLQPLTPQWVADMFAQVVTPFYDGVSYHQTSLTADTTPVYRLPQTATAYATANLINQLAGDARAAAAADYRLADYDRFVIAFTYIGPPFYVGPGSVTNVPGSLISFLANALLGGDLSWFNGFFESSVFAHELGHNYGVTHASLWHVTDGNPVSAGGRVYYYADPFDMMGSSPKPIAAEFDATKRYWLGWLPESAVATATSSGTYRVYRFDSPAANLTHPLALRVFRNGKYTYWLGLRQKFPLNNSLTHGAYTVWGRNYPEDSLLLDLTTPGNDETDAALAPGATLDDPNYGVRITNLGQGGTAPDEYLDVQISLANSPSFVAKWGEVLVDPPEGLRGIRDIAAGNYHALLLREDGTVQALTDGSAGPNYLPGQAVVPAGLDQVTAVAASGNHSLALRRDGTVVAWGENAHGQSAVPTGLRDVTALAASDSNSLALKADGTVVGWGAGFNGSLTPPPGLDHVKAIATGYAHSLALRDDGTVVAWGTPYSAITTVPASLHDVVAIAAGGDYSLALQRDGTVVAWGGVNILGQLDVPPGLHDVVAIATNATHVYTNLALQADGTIVGWGGNNIGHQIDCPVGARAVLRLAVGWGFCLALISPIPVDLSLGNLTPTYDGTPRTVSVTTSPAGVPVTVFYDGSVLPPTNAGTYVIEATVADPNYIGRSHRRQTIAQAPLTARADDRTRLVGAANPPLTISYTGFVHGETEAVLSASPTAHTDADVASPPGYYPITLSGGMAANYAFTLQSGTLEVYTFRLPLPPIYERWPWPWKPWWLEPKPLPWPWKPGWWEPKTLPFFPDLATLRTTSEMNATEFWWRMNRDTGAQPGWSLRLGTPR